MPARLSKTATQRLETIRAKVSTERLRDLAVLLAENMMGELSTIQPWMHGNIGRGLLQMSQPKPTSTGGWIVGVGNLGILGRPDEAAPSRTISEFLIWYRAQMAEEQERERRAAAIKRERRPTVITTLKERYERAVAWISTEGERPTTTEEQRRKYDAVHKEFITTSSQLSERMSDTAFEAWEEEMRKRYYGY